MLGYNQINYSLAKSVCERLTSVFQDFNKLILIFQNLRLSYIIKTNDISIISID